MVRSAVEDPLPEAVLGDWQGGGHAGAGPDVGRSDSHRRVLLCVRVGE